MELALFEEQTINIKFVAKLGKYGLEIFECLKQAYGDNSLKFKWLKRFHEGQEGVKVDHRTWRHSTSSSEENLERIRSCVLKEQSFMKFWNKKLKWRNSQRKAKSWLRQGLVVSSHWRWMLVLRIRWGAQISMEASRGTETKKVAKIKFQREDNVDCFLWFSEHSSQGIYPFQTESERKFYETWTSLSLCGSSLFEFGTRG